MFLNIYLKTWQNDKITEKDTLYVTWRIERRYYEEYFDLNIGIRTLECIFAVHELYQTHLMIWKG